MYCNQLNEKKKYSNNCKAVKYCFLFVFSTKLGRLVERCNDMFAFYIHLMSLVVSKLNI